MKIGYFILNDELRSDARLHTLLEELESATFELYEIRTKSDVRPETDLVLSMGGDGTFLSAAHVVADIGLPILGVNFGRIGFLCENRPEAVSKALLEGDFRIEYRTVLNATLKGPEARRTIGMLPYSVNEVSLHRTGSSVLGIHVCVDGEPLPTYWADGLMPIAPHNLNVRPIVVPETAKIDISFESRDGSAIMSTDNRVEQIQPDWTIHVEMAQFSLKRIRLAESGFVKALTSRLFWGEDMRNI